MINRFMDAADAFAGSFAETGASYHITAYEAACDVPMPDPEEAMHATELLIRTIFDLLRDTRMENLSDRIAWGIVHSLHKVSQQIDAQADKAAQQVRGLIRHSDGSEIGSVRLEEAQALCQSLDANNDAIACMRDYAAATYLAETGRPWSSPRASLTSSRRTASIVDATDFLAARRQKRISSHAPEGPVILFSGGRIWEDHQLLWGALDAIRARIPTMILATTAQDKGCDAIAAAWAARNACPLIAFNLDRRLGNRAGFARNAQMIALGPVEAIVCEGSGLQSHLAREVRRHGIPAHFFRLTDQKQTRK